MDWVVAVSAGEIAGGALSPETERGAHAAFREHGCVLLRGAYPCPAIEAMFNEYVARYGTLNAQGMQDAAAKPPPNRFLRVGDARYEITLRVSGASRRAGRDRKSPLAPVPRPAARRRHASERIHGRRLPSGRDPAACSSRPCPPVRRAGRRFGLAGLRGQWRCAPLIDVDIETGPTGVWLGSHRWARRTSAAARQTMTACSFQRGDCVLLDYRTLHTGLPNLSGRIRPIVYMVYTRPWFFDEVNHVNRISPRHAAGAVRSASRIHSSVADAGILPGGARAMARGRRTRASPAARRQRPLELGQDRTQ